MWLIKMSREEIRRWMMTPSDIVRYTCVVQYVLELKERWLERWRNILFYYFEVSNKVVYTTNILYQRTEQLPVSVFSSGG